MNNTQRRYMNIPNEVLQAYAPYITHGLLAIFGAFTHAASAHREGKSKTFMDFVLLTIMSSFSGVMFALMGFHFFGQGSYITLAMAGTGGFMGVEGMTWVVKVIVSKFPSTK